MASDIRHVLSGFLTATMLVMFCNTIKKDHIDPLLDNISAQSITANNKIESSTGNGRGLPAPSSNPWEVNNSKEALNPCWRKSTISESQESKGFVFVTLAQDPEYHSLQIANAVVVAKYLGATLVLPSLRYESGQKRKFGEIYDLNKFSASLDGKVALAMDSKSVEMYTQKVTTLSVPNMVSKEYINSNIEPIFKTTRSLRISTFFPSNMEHKRMNPYGCLAVFDSLWLRPELQESIDSMIGKLRSHSKGRFIAVDYRPGRSQCSHENENGGTKHCIDAKEIALFLEKVGFEKETTIYLTRNIENLRDFFPNTFTKDAIIPENEKSKFLDPKNPVLEHIVDIFISSAANVYVTTSVDLFADNVVARRIGTRKTQVLMPSANKSLSLAEDYVPAYLSRRNHWAYSCFC